MWSRIYYKGWHKKVNPKNSKYVFSEIPSDFKPVLWFSETRFMTTQKYQHCSLALLSTVASSLSVWKDPFVVLRMYAVTSEQLSPSTCLPTLLSSFLPSIRQRSKTWFGVFLRNRYFISVSSWFKTSSSSRHQDRRGCPPPSVKGPFHPCYQTSWVGRLSTPLARTACHPPLPQITTENYTQVPFFL